MKKLLLLLTPFILFASQAILALSWQKGFCKTHYAYECKYTKNYDYFTIHGLWPKKQNCYGTKVIRLPKSLYLELKEYMPSKKLMFHEWKKHGTCYSKKPVKYFSDALRLAKIVNNSKIREFFQKNEGKIITKQALNKVINSIYPRSARKVKMICNRGYVTELRFSLKGDIANDSLQTLLKNGKPQIGGCNKGRIAK